MGVTKSQTRLSDWTTTIIYQREIRNQWQKRTYLLGSVLYLFSLFFLSTNHRSRLVRYCGCPLLGANSCWLPGRGCISWRVFWQELPTILMESVAVRSLNVSDSATPWAVACQASLSFTISWSLLKLMSIELVMPSSHRKCNVLFLPAPRMNMWQPKPNLLKNIRYANELFELLVWPHIFLMLI